MDDKLLDIKYGWVANPEYCIKFKEWTEEEIIEFERLQKISESKEMIQDYKDWCKEMIKFSIYWTTGFIIIGTPILSIIYFLFK